MAKRLDYNQVYKFFTDNGCELLSVEYLNDKQLLSFRCLCGAISFITLNNFRNRKRCSECGYKETGNKKRHSLQFVKGYFSLHGCSLISESYKDANTKLRYICVCGNYSEITFGHFKSGQRCKWCQNQKLSQSRTGIKRPEFSGHNNPNWDFSKTLEERLSQRNYPEYREWSLLVKRRDNFTCLLCETKGGELHSHHLDGYSWCAKRRTDVSNGVTLCFDCHRDFHNIYGQSNNTEAQFREYATVVKRRVYCDIYRQLSDEIQCN